MKTMTKHQIDNLPFAILESESRPSNSENESSLSLKGSRLSIFQILISRNTNLGIGGIVLSAQIRMIIHKTVTAHELLKPFQYPRSGEQGGLGHIVTTMCLH